MEKIVVSRAEKRCHCEERSDVAIPRIFRNVLIGFRQQLDKLVFVEMPP